MSATDPHFTHLPREVLDNIARFLPTLSFNNMRLTCKNVEDKLFEYWSNSFFKKKQFMITEFSLQTLVDISRHQTLAPRLKHLVIGLDHLQSINPASLATMEDRMQYKQACHSQNHLLDSGRAIELLSTALANLEVGTIDIRNFNSNTRSRDRFEPGNYGTGTWMSYGYSQCTQWVQHLRSGGLLVNANHEDFIRRVLKALIIALGRNTPHVRSLEVMLRNTGLGLTDGAFFVGPETSKLPAVLAGLTKLHLDIGNEPGDPVHWVDKSSPEGKIPTSALEARDPDSVCLRNFLRLAPNVTWLRLNFPMRGQKGGRLLPWLALDGDKFSGWDDTNPKPISPSLRRLDLGRASLSPKTLAMILKKFDKLESCSFRNVTLLMNTDGSGGVEDIDEVDGSEGEDEEDAEEDENRGSAWARIFRVMPKLAPDLKRLSLSGLRESRAGRGKDDIWFVKSKTRDTGTDEAPLGEREFVKTDRSSFETLADETWLMEVYCSTLKSLQHDEYGSQAGEDSDGQGTSVGESEDDEDDDDDMDD